MSNPVIGSALLSKLTQSSPDPSRSAIVDISGKEGAGKTGLALTVSMLGPTVYIPMDRKPKGDYIEEQLRARKIMRPKTNYKNLSEGRAFNQATATKVWDELHGLMTDINSDKAIRAVILDTGTYAWALIRMARFGKLTQVMPHHYGPVNTEFENVFYAAEEAGKIIIAIHKMSKEYKAGKDGKENWTGNYEPSGFSHMAFVSNMRLTCFRTEDHGFGVRVLQNKLAPGMDGTELTGDECMFPCIAHNTWGGSLEDFIVD